MKPTHARYMLMFLALALLAGTVQGMEDGTAIDWRKNIISSRGISSIRVNKAGKPVSLHDGQVVSINEARRAAYERSREIALEKMISLLKTIQVNQDHTLEELMERDENTQLKLGSLLDGKSGRQFPADFYSSGCELKITMGEIMECLNFSYPDRDFPARMDVPIETAYSGLIVDTRGFHMKPMIFPVIYNRNGLEIVSQEHISGPAAARYGMVSYVNRDDEARKNKRIGEHPLFAVAVNKNGGCPVLSEADVRKLFSSQKTLKALRECRIVFIIDRK